MEAVKEVAIVAAPSNTLSTFERLASDPNINVDNLERLMQMHERMAAKQSEELFNAAMTAAQKAMRPIAADANNPQTKSKYASYAKLDGSLRPIYTENGFGLSFDTGDSPKEHHLRVLCYVTHSGGHSKTYRIDIPADGKGAKGGDVMTLTHAAGAAASYGMRYLLKMIFNVAVGEDDTDGNVIDQRPEPPAGFEDWIADLDVVAEDGLDALSEAWKKSADELKRYALKYFAREHEQRKARASRANKAGAK